MATNSSILALKIPWTEESVRLYSMGLAKSWTRLGTQHNITHTLCGECAGLYIYFTYLNNTFMYWWLTWLKVILLATTNMHITLLGTWLIIHRICKNDPLFPLFCSSCKERVKTKTMLPEHKLHKFLKSFCEEKAFGKYSSLNSQDLPTYQHKIYFTLWLADTYYFTNK